MSAAAYIKQVAPAAQQAVKGTGLFASVMIAQAANESGFGDSSLTRLYNNHFGIKGKGVALDTTEYVKGVKVPTKASFRSYNSTQDSFTDYVSFLSSNKRYGNAGVFNATTPEGEAKALQAAGYATDPKYSDKLIRIINQYNLKQYDGKVSPASQNNAVMPANNKAMETDKKHITITLPMIIAVLVGLVLFSVIMQAR